MNIIELIRKRVDIFRRNDQRTPLEIVNQIMNTSTEKEWFITNGSFLLFDPIDERSLDVALNTYRNELQRVEAMEDGIFRERGMENGYTLSENEATCWGAYYTRLQNQRRSHTDLNRIIDECNVIVQQFLPQPAQSSDRRGMVIGQVQSGKTTIFNGIISAAADMGFNVILVLSGTIESLRRQTQKRIDLDVTRPWGQKTDTPFYFTWISNHNGSGLAVAGRGSQVLTELSNPGRRQVAIGVFLKNAAVLNNLRNFVNSINAVDQPHIRALIIDDEADQATPNAGVNRNTISSINRAVKSLVVHDSNNFCSLQGRTSYLGFTATPFANLLNEAGPNTLYPKDFLYFLRPSGRYFGPWQLFGNPDEIEGEETIIPLDVIRLISNDDINATVPSTGRPKPAYNPSMADGLKNSIRWFALAAAMRRVYDPESWATMLIHTSSNISAHEELYNVVNGFTENLHSDWASRNVEWRTLWTEETSRVTIETFSAAFPAYGQPDPVSYPEWGEVVRQMDSVIQDIQVKIDNSLYVGPERLIFDDEAPPDQRLQIAIGGNTLSRGLTLEGLVSSYFARRFTSQSSYDTLLQMGRWFGFRQGYELLPRLWTTEFLRDGFRDLVIMEQNLRKSLQLYLRGHSPANKAPVITRMPSMAITRRNVLGSIGVVEADYSGTAPQTILFKNDAEWLGNNLAVTRRLLNDINNFRYSEAADRLLFTSVPVSFITQFIENFNFWPHTNTFNKRHMLDYIRKYQDEYSEWSVVVSGGTGNGPMFNGTEVIMNNRSRIRDDNESSSRPLTFINLKSLRATRDLLCDRPDLIPRERIREEDLWDLREHHNLNPVLILYPINRNSTYAGTNTQRADLNAEEHIVGVSLVMNPPGGQEGARGIQLDITDAYSNEEDAEDNPDLPDPEIQAT
jgi:hypothetical protein